MFKKYDENRKERMFQSTSDPKPFKQKLTSTDTVERLKDFVYDTMIELRLPKDDTKAKRTRQIQIQFCTMVLNR